VAVLFYQGITDFIFVEDTPQKADIIFVPGGNYPEAAQHAAELYQQGLAPYVMPSGKYSILKGRLELPGDDRYATECEYLCDILRKNGVPDQAILRENQATFTWENAIYSRRKLEELGVGIRRALLSCQAFHARRCLMYYQEQFPEVEFLVSPVVTRGISRDTWQQSEEGIATVLGEVERCGSQFHQILKDHRNKRSWEK
jgi:uncharacterized SAM-binding protein YcdF (DUF218 family)